MFLCHVRPDTHQHASLQRRLIDELIKIISQMWHVTKFALFAFVTFVLFLFTFEKVIQGLGFIAPFLVRYIVGEYLTLLPEYLVLPLMIIPSKYSMSILGVSSFMSFFIVFLV
jgi:hypothetical protein